MTSARYKSMLRMLYGAVMTSRLSAAELKELSQELRNGRLGDELGYMIDRALDHFGSTGPDEPEEERISGIEVAVRRSKMNRAQLASVITSLGFSVPSSRSSVRQMIQKFVNDAPANRVAALIKMLESDPSSDQFLAGIEKSRK